MTWLEAISELCRQLDSETTIDDILVTAVDENMITADDARAIALNIGLEGSQFSPNFLGFDVTDYPTNGNFAK